MLIARRLLAYVGSITVVHSIPSARLNLIASLLCQPDCRPCATSGDVEFNRGCPTDWSCDPSLSSPSTTLHATRLACHRPAAYPSPRRCRMWDSNAITAIPAGLFDFTTALSSLCGYPLHPCPWMPARAGATILIARCHMLGVSSSFLQRDRWCPSHRCGVSRAADPVRH